MADTLAPGGILMRICPMRLHGWVSLCNAAVYSWLDDRAPSMGAAIAYYTVFSLAPMLGHRQLGICRLSESTLG